MYNEENEAVAKLVQWVRSCDTIWEMICDDSGWYLALEDIIELMEEMISKGQYQMVMVLLGKMDKNRFVHEAISMVIINRVKNPNCETGILPECVNAIKKIAKQHGVMRETLTI